MIIEHLNRLLQEAGSTLPGLISAAVFDPTGNIIVKHSTDNSINVELEGAYQVEIVKQAKLFLQMSEINKGNELGIITVETDNYSYYLVSSASGSMYFVLMVDAKKSNMGITRLFIEKQRTMLRGTF